MKFLKLLIAVTGASVLLGALASTASARVFSVSSQSLGAIFRSVTFRMPFGDTVCAMTISGSLHTRTIAKVANALVGYINRATLGACSSGAATILTETLPWHLTYGDFTGTLPNVTGFNTNILNMSFRVREPAFITCLARSAVLTGILLRELARVAFRIIVSKALSGILRTDCGVDGTMSSDAAPAATTPGGATRITITLI